MIIFLYLAGDFICGLIDSSVCPFKDLIISPTNGQIALEDSLQGICCINVKIHICPLKIPPSSIREQYK